MNSSIVSRWARTGAYLLLLAALAFGLALGTAAVVAADPSLLGVVDLSNTAVSPDVDGTAMGTNGHCMSFSDEVLGSWGGEYGDGAVTAFPGDPDPAGQCIFKWSTGGNAGQIKMRVLDGIADDSFDVYAKIPGGQWTLVYTYSDVSTSEVWVAHSIDVSALYPEEGAATQIRLKIVPTNLGWGGFNTWGQLAVDSVEVWSQ